MISSDSDIELITLEPIRPGHPTLIYVRPCAIQASAWSDDIPIKSSIDESMKLIPLEPDIRSGGSTLIHVNPCESPLSAWTDDFHIKSSIDISIEFERKDEFSSCDETDDATLVSSSGSGSECLVEPSEKIYGDQISLSSVCDCVSEHSERTNTQVENLRGMKENLAYMDLILEERLMPTSHVEEEPSKSIGCFSWMTRWLPCKKGHRPGRHAPASTPAAPSVCRNRLQMRNGTLKRAKPEEDYFLGCCRNAV
ncbi:hypothetical protein DPEC_G00054570 [Dallia pectoralis]|uniref:Uncharacterized protein n=1 Tax=Dallia pectoralis TaxID=75939 RepID=A0ACC2H5Z8_DALPE|nr:hypothetical protein DPEC_G00054570 [Dallia pectoralis]